MAPKLPEGFLEIAEAAKKVGKEPYNVIGLCTDYLEPAQSRGTDLAMKMQFWDLSCASSHDLQSDGMTVRCFYKKVSAFPPVEEAGDVVIAHNLRSWSHGVQRIGISGGTTRWTVISGSSLLDSTEPDLSDVTIRKPREGSSSTVSSRPSRSELRFAKSLIEAKDPSTLRGPPRSTALNVASIMKENGGKPSSMNPKFRLVTDIESPLTVNRHQYVDLVVEVRRVYSGNGNPIEVHLTDYTEHSLLYEYCEADGEAGQNTSSGGPWGKMIITVNAWDQHGDFIMEKVRNGEITLGTYLRLSNVQIKMDRFGTLMQGHLRGSSGCTGTNINVLPTKDTNMTTQLKDLVSRKRAYNVDRKSRAIGFVKDEPSKKRPAESEPADQAEPKKKKSKSAKRKEKTRLEKAKARDVSDGHSVQTADGSNAHINQHVRCEAVNISLTTIATIRQDDMLSRKTPAGSIYSLPFQNCKYKSKVQVVDFFPDNLEDFATPYLISDYEDLSDYDSVEDDEEACSNHIESTPAQVRWKWHFFLMVEDPRASQNAPEEREMMLLQVSGKDAEYLLNLDPCDLKSEPQQMAKLKEKMFVLWGDLEEKKRENGKSGMQLRDQGTSISSKPFECLIKEYGVRARTRHDEVLEDDWERMFSIFGTNIG